ncbi:MAG: hypothetical protein WBH47_26910 [Streptosporangiaceae bacterium]
MTGQTSEWPREHRELQAHLAAEAAANPGGSVAEIDGNMVTNPDGYVPAEAIIGCFVVGLDGRATGEYVRSPGYGPVRDDFTRLEQPDHWLGWLPDTPARSVREQLQDLLASQVEESVLDWVKITDEPVFVTAGARSPADPQILIVRRAGLAAVFALGVRPPQGKPEVLTGAFTWATVGLDKPGQPAARNARSCGRPAGGYLRCGCPRHHRATQPPPPVAARR